MAFDYCGNIVPVAQPRLMTQASRRPPLGGPDEIGGS